MHHVSIRTANIHRAIGFYETLGFKMEERFTAGYTLACWMTGLGGRIELLQVPEPHTDKQAAPDPFGDEHYVGYYHMSFDLTGQIADLDDWLAGMQAKFDGNLTVLLQPQQQQIGPRVYEVAFIVDTDGMPIEFLRQLA
jgi:catechol 2,3-dioxygenase-like lactoylglutathione lyase family enzyme